MAQINDLKKQLKQARKEADKINRAIVEAKISDKLKCITSIVMRSEFFCDRIVSMPTDEVGILLNEIINSDGFAALLEDVSKNSARLAELRAGKAAKAEKRKHDSFSAEQPACTGNDDLF